MDIDDRKFDSRIIERNIRKGITTHEEYEEYLKNLKDCEMRSNAVETSLEAIEEESEALNKSYEEE